MRRGLIFLAIIALLLAAVATVQAAPQHRGPAKRASRSEEHTSELQSQSNLVCRPLLDKKKATKKEQAAEPQHVRSDDPLPVGVGCSQAASSQRQPDADDPGA